MGSIDEISYDSHYGLRGLKNLLHLSTGVNIKVTSYCLYLWRTDGLTLQQWYHDGFGD